MAWCCQATRHYLNQCWPRYMSQSGVSELTPVVARVDSLLWNKGDIQSTDMEKSSLKFIFGWTFCSYCICYYDSTAYNDIEQKVSVVTKHTHPQPATPTPIPTPTQPTPHPTLHSHPSAASCQSVLSCEVLLYILALISVVGMLYRLPQSSITRMDQL